MYDWTTFQWIELVGWLASVLTVATYAMNTMLPLRICAIASTLCFTVYAAVLQLWPLFVMDLILLPINIYRLWQILSLRRKVRQSPGNGVPDFSVIKTYGKSRTLKEGEVVFRKGDRVDRLYFLGSGTVLIEEYDVKLGAGEIFGEMAFFTDEAVRTATARCIDTVQVYELDETRFMRLQFEDPQFGLSVMRTITRRLIENARGVPRPQTAAVVPVDPAPVQ